MLKKIKKNVKFKTEIIACENGYWQGLYAGVSYNNKSSDSEALLSLALFTHFYLHFLLLLTVDILDSVHALHRAAS